MKIVRFFSDGVAEFNSDNWRCLIPSRALAKAGHDVHLLYIKHWMENSEKSRRLCSDADLIVLTRVMVEESLYTARYWRERKKPIVVDYDDAYQIIDDTNLAHKFWGKGEVEINMAFGVKFEKPLDRHPLEQFREGIVKYCTGATMPSRILFEDWKDKFPCWYIPNYIDSGRYLATKGQVKPDPNYITIGYGGSLSHVPSFKYSGIEEAFYRVCQKRPKARIMICGDKRLYDRVPVPEDRKVFYNYVKWNEWSYMLGKFDIGIAPMALRYDSSRSFIKPLEYTMMGIPFVASKTLAYVDWYDVGSWIPMETEVLEIEKRSVMWEEVLLAVIDNYDFYKNDVESKFEMAMRWDVDRCVGELEESYQDIVKVGKERM